MAKRIVLTVSIFIFVAFEFTACDHRSPHLAPTIKLFDPDIDLDLNTDEVIECVSNQPVTWISEIPHNHDSLFSIKNEKHNKLTYKSNLIFRNITTRYVGRYYCVLSYFLEDYRTSYDEKVNFSQASTIYVFVKDPDNPLVKLKDLVINGKDTQLHVIPCKPTSKDVKTRIKSERGEIVPIKSFYPEVGMTVNLSNFENGRFYHCEVVGREEHNFEFKIFKIPHNIHEKPRYPLQKASNHRKVNVTDMNLVTNSIVTFNLMHYPDIRVKEGEKQAELSLYYNASHDATIFIYNPRNQLVAVDNTSKFLQKYEIIFSQNETKNYICIIVKLPNLLDFGDYKFMVNCSGISFERTVKLIVYEKPKIHLHDVSAHVGAPISSKFMVTGYPASNITCEFFYCVDEPSWPDCKNFSKAEVELSVITVSDHSNNTMQQIEFKSTPAQSGRLRCYARNIKGTASASANVTIARIYRASLISRSDMILEGDSVSLECGAIIYSKLDQLSWRKIGENIDDINVKSLKTQTYSHQTIIEWKNISKMDSGVYECVIQNYIKTKNQGGHSINITVLSPKINFISSNAGSKIQLSIGENLTLDCLTSGDFPTLTLTWYKNDMIFSNNVSITFDSLTIEDSGLYRCDVENRFGSASKTYVLNVEKKYHDDENLTTVNSEMGVIGIIIFIIACLCITTVVAVVVRIKYSFRRQQYLNPDESKNGDVNDMNRNSESQNLSSDSADIQPEHENMERNIEQDLTIDMSNQETYNVTIDEASPADSSEHSSPSNETENSIKDELDVSENIQKPAIKDYPQIEGNIRRKFQDEIRAAVKKRFKESDSEDNDDDD